MGDTMARPQHGWSQDPYAPRQSTDPGAARHVQHESTRERIHLPGPSSLFAAATAASSPPPPLSLPLASSIGLPPPGPSRASPPPPCPRPASYYSSSYAASSPVGQAPLQLSAPNNDAQSQAQAQAQAQAQPGPLAVRTTGHGPDSCFSSLHSPIPIIWPDDNMPPRYQPPSVYRYPPLAPTSFSDAVLNHAKANAAYRYAPTRPSISRRMPARSASPQAEATQMSINRLLSKETAPRSTIPLDRAADAAKTSRTTNTSSARSSPSSEYRICVRQQPLAARSCGFGERDRRVIDPPPIVQLSIDDPEATPEKTRTRLRFQYTVLHCSIWNDAGDQDYSAMPEDYRQQRRLMGTLVSSPFVGQDEIGNEGCFFCFPDLSCRTPGSFRLKFALVILDPLGMRAGASSPIMATAMSDVFTVYNAKDFPGMQASTALTKRLKEQGCLISIKKGNEKTGAVHLRDDSDDEETGDRSNGQSRKRLRRI